MRDAPLRQHGGPASTVDTACPLDCPDGCSLSATVQRGRVIAVDGSRRNPVTGGFICAKVRRFAERVYSPDRLLYPAVRKGAKGQGLFSRVTWDEALDLVARRMQEIRDRWGGAAILPFSYGGSNGLVSQDTADAELWRRFGTSRLARTVCAAPTGAANQALYGKMPSVAYEDFVHARLIVLWGVNPSVSGIHLVPYVREAQRRGARLVVIDPRVTPLARLADLHLPVRPGTDVAVALAVHRHLFAHGHADRAFLDAHTRGSERLQERAEPWTPARAADTAGVEAERIETLARWYAESSPALIRCGWGLERNRNGGNAALAVLALPAVGGKFGVRGGGYAMSNSPAWGIRQTWIEAEEPPTRLVNMNQLGRALTAFDDPPVQMLFVYNCNPAVTMPNQNLVLKGLERDDLFTVVFEQVMTDTALYADVVLPATTFLEHYDLARAYGPISLQIVHPVVEASGEARPNAEVFGELAQRLELVDADAPAEDTDVLFKVLDALPGDAGAALRRDERPVPPFGSTPVQFVDVFPRTADGRVDLFPEALEASAPAGLYRYQPEASQTRYPLALISPASDRTISSTLGELPRPDVRLLMHPDDARARGLEEGDLVRVFNDLGEVRCRLGLAPALRPGVVSLPKGIWCRNTANGRTATALAPDTLTDLGGGACFNDARVEVGSVAQG
ncbi:MAG: molybdopterin-dependent oxidoreductase [Acidobacteriota bacterium]|nr:molybdopterin-dependent oxidoreductase [Acidobacteriota bacterium]